MGPQKTQNCQSHPEKKEQSWRHNPPRLQTILQSYSNQNSMVLAQQQTYGQLIFNKGGTNIQQRKSLFNKWCSEKWTATCKRMKSEHYLTLYTKINSKWTKDLNVRPDTMKLLEENIGRTLCNIFLDPSPRIMEIQTKINK